MKTILVPIDLSPSAKRVCAEAAKLADLTRARLVLLHVTQPPPIVTTDLNAFALAQFSTAIAAGVKLSSRKFAAFAAGLKRRRPATKVVHLTGNPAPMILAQAKSLKADYIVLGSHGHGAIYDLLVGSTTQAILKRARCPVLVVPSPTGKRRR